MGKSHASQWKYRQVKTCVNCEWAMGAASPNRECVFLIAYKAESRNINKNTLRLTYEYILVTIDITIEMKTKRLCTNTMCLVCTIDCRSPYSVSNMKMVVCV